MAVYSLCAALVGCASPRSVLDLTPEPETDTVWVIERGWHTDIGIEASSAGRPLADVRVAFPGVRVLVFGFGDRTYLLHREHGLDDMLAALLPGAGAILVTALRGAPDAAFPPEDVVSLRISARQRARLTEFIAASFSRGDDGTHQKIANGPYPGSAFFASSVTYSLGFTCNTWTAEGLQSAGLPVRASGVLFAGGVMRQVRRHAATTH